MPVVWGAQRWSGTSWNTGPGLLLEVTQASAVPLACSLVDLHSCVYASRAYVPRRRGK